MKTYTVSVVEHAALERAIEAASDHEAIRHARAMVEDTGDAMFDGDTAHDWWDYELADDEPDA